MKNWPQIRRILRIAGTFIGLVIFGYQLYVGITNLAAQKQQLHLVWGWVFLALAVYLLVYFLQMVNLWLMYQTNFPDIQLKPIVQGNAMSFLPKYTPGYIWGYLSRADWLESRAGIPGAYSWLATVLEVVTTLMSGLVVLLLNWALRGGRSLALAGLALLLPWLVWLLLRAAFHAARRYIKKVERQQVLQGFAISFPRWALISVNSIFQWLLLGVGLRLIGAGFSYPQGLPFWTALWKHIYAFCLSWLGGFLAVLIPNGLGVRETVLNTLLESQAGLAASAAVVISVASRVLLFLTELGWLLLALLIKQNPFADQKYS